MMDLPPLAFLQDADVGCQPQHPSQHQLKMRLLPAAITLSSLASTLAFVPSTPLSSLRSASSLSRLFSATSDVTGTVKWYNAERGFGFIAIDDGGADMYVHATGLTFDGPLIENERVGFTTEIDARTNKPKAVAVVRVGEEEDVVNTEAEEESDAVAAAAKMNEEEDRTKQAEAKAAADKAEEDARIKAEAEAKAAKAEKERIAAEAKAAEEALIAEEARLAKEAEEARIAKEKEEARIAAEKAEEDAKARGYPSVAIMKARMQPKSESEEASLSSKYAAMSSLGERAFAILIDLGMVDINPDPDAVDFDSSAYAEDDDE
eukprot:g8215.t1.1.5e1746ab g8215  g8215.t1 contig29:19375-21641(-)